MGISYLTGVLLDCFSRVNLSVKLKTVDRMFEMKNNIPHFNLRMSTLQFVFRSVKVYFV